MGLESAAALPLSTAVMLGSPFKKGLLFLLNLAWESRFRIPMIIMVGTMILDIRMQLEINIDVELRQVNYIDDDLDSDSSSESSEDSGTSSVVLLSDEDDTGDE